MPDPDLKSLSMRASRGLARFVPTRLRLNLSRQPVLSFTFDDVPESAYSEGARLLDDQGLKGTFYIAPGLCGLTEPQWRVISTDQVADLARRGHEIGGHTFGHCAVQSLKPRDLLDEDDRCHSALKEICGDIALKSFAFPFGNAGIVSKCLLQTRYQTCRGIRVGINRGPVDLAMLSVQQLYDVRLSTKQIDAQLDSLMRHGGWQIYCTHDVTTKPTGIGCSPALLDYAIKAATSRGIACMTVAAAAAELSLVHRRFTSGLGIEQAQPGLKSPPAA